MRYPPPKRAEPFHTAPAQQAGGTFPGRLSRVTSSRSIILFGRLSRVMSCQGLTSKNISPFSSANCSPSFVDTARLLTHTGSCTSAADHPRI
jgi:hypothetical protein